MKNQKKKKQVIVLSIPDSIHAARRSRRGLDRLLMKTIGCTIQEAFDTWVQSVEMDWHAMNRQQQPTPYRNRLPCQNTHQIRTPQTT